MNFRRLAWVILILFSLFMLLPAGCGGGSSGTGDGNSGSGGKWDQMIWDQDKWG